MDDFVKSTKSISSAKLNRSVSARSHPYRSRHDIVNEICCASYPARNVSTSSCRGHQASQGSGRRTSYFQSRNNKLAHQFKARLSDSQQPSEPQIFRNCCIYINGYMGTSISDIELRRRLAIHGATIVANFGRKSVTHVILGPNGLAGTKIQKEMLAKKIPVKYVTVEWYVLDWLFY